MPEDIIIELAIIERQCREAVEQKIRSRQLGEAWIGLEIGREENEAPIFYARG